MKILVYGAGAIGSAIGERLSYLHDITLVSRKPHADAISSNGLIVCSSKGRGKTFLKCITSIDDVETPDVVIITTKAYDSKYACDDILRIIDNNTIVVSIQNGLGNYEHISHRFGRNGVVGTTTMGVTMTRPGEIVLAGEGVTAFGPYDDAAEKITDMFIKSGFEARTSKRIFSDIWMKAIANAAINPITVVAGRTNGCILCEPYMSLAKEACYEAAAVAEAEGISLDNPWKTVLDIAEKTSSNKSSMLQDIEKGKKTEINQITGEIVRRARGVGISVPVNNALLELIRSMEKRDKKS